MAFPLRFGPRFFSDRDVEEFFSTRNHQLTGFCFQLGERQSFLPVSYTQLDVYKRQRPTDKQRLVQLLQQKGAVVAVTGDGTNDAPALNHAQVGLSMGTGTSVAKEASDITLLDASFHSIGTVSYTHLVDTLHIGHYNT